ncbi:hypothetical protein N7509_011623 [Penicillium cosmopolitanum]|uniref:Major facilitator superfamily (MFS) profile domain-containing protein n=1 Tax=Penicillium cosmopolitanum TaxID=1131564 RepID=A0A9W9VF51_9EURO|nr:uncharacterized protein N7509_011623 [Penicillium cosmopolitanum]KAJ5378504.1 hypothetical protein N7509_011623 [Penicillium cosmopolitanum]
MVADTQSLPNETAPLLSPTPNSEPPTNNSSSSNNNNNNGRKKLLILVACGIFILAADFGFFLSQAPQTAIFERIICRNYLLNSRDDMNASLLNSPSEDPCKSELVQGELALINGYKETFDVLPSILLSLPYGVLADHWGRKPVLYLGVVGIILGEFWVRLVAAWSTVLPLRMVWMTALFRIIGGGDQVITSMAIAMVADVFSEEERSTAIFRLSSCVLIAEILATPFSAYLMTFDIWYPYILGLVVVVVGTLPAIFIPETLADAKAKMKNHADEAPLASIEGMEPPSKQPMWQEIIHQAREFKKSTRFIWRDGNICLLVIIAGVGFMSRQSTGLLMQYASKKFNWSIGKASLLISLRGIFSLSNYLVLMPAFNSIAGRFFNLHGKYRDYRLTQVTSVFTAVGFGIMAFAPVPGILIWGLLFLSIGLGFLVTTRSLVTALVLPNHIGTLYSALAISQALGGLIAGPLFAYLFRLGMHLGNAWMGLPWLQASVIFILVSIVSWYIRVRDPVSHDEEEPHLAE